MSSNFMDDGVGGSLPAEQIHFNGPVIGTDPKSLAKYVVADIAVELRALQARTTGPLLGK